MRVRLSLDRSGTVVGMIGVSAPAYRLPLQKIHREIGPAVLEATREITLALGGRSTAGRRRATAARDTGTAKPTRGRPCRQRTERAQVAGARRVRRALS
jgi:hypothetical protein